MNKIIYYYQTFIGLNSILNQKPRIVTDIFVSSIHFGKNLDLSPYIHLNDNPPNNLIFNDLWKEIQLASNLGIKIHLMVGGAGGAYEELFSNYDVYYNLLKTFINSKKFINGINLDIEEEVDINNVIKLIQDIKNDFGERINISMAPMSYSLQNDVKGMGNFIYKDLVNSLVGKYIDFFNGQFYGNLTLKSFEDCLNNGYPQEKIVLGMLASELNNNNEFSQICKQIKLISKKYPNFGGVFVWEYFNAPPSGIKNPGNWAKNIKSCLNYKRYIKFYKKKNNNKNKKKKYQNINFSNNIIKYLYYPKNYFLDFSKLVSFKKKKCK